MLRTHRAGKGSGGCGGRGLGSRNRRGPGVPPTPGLRGQRTSPGSPAGFLGSSGWGKCPPLLSCSSGLGGPLPPASPDLPCLPPMPPRTHAAWRGLGGQGIYLGAQQAPWAWVGRAIALCSSPTPPRGPLPPASPGLPGLLPMPPGPMWPGWGFGGRGTGLGAQQAPRPEWARRLSSAPLPLFLESRSRLPLLISPASGAPILSGLHFSFPLSPPTSYRFTLGFFLSPWASESPTMGWQAPYLWGDANSTSSHVAIFFYVFFIKLFRSFDQFD